MSIAKFEQYLAAYPESMPMLDGLEGLKLGGEMELEIEVIRAQLEHKMDQLGEVVAEMRARAERLRRIEDGHADDGIRQGEGTEDC